MTSMGYRQVGFTQDAQLYADVSVQIKPKNFCDNLIKIKTYGVVREVLINVLEIQSIEFPMESIKGFNGLIICLRSGKEYSLNMKEGEKFLYLISSSEGYVSSLMNKYKEQG